MAEHHFHIDRTPYSRRVGLFLSTLEGERLSVARSITFEMIDPNEYAGGEPLLRLKEAEAQQLMDALWAAGIRPTEGAGSAGAMAAVTRHLEDMRRLVFADRVEISGRMAEIHVPSRGTHG